MIEELESGLLVSRRSFLGWLPALALVTASPVFARPRTVLVTHPSWTGDRWVIKTQPWPSLTWPHRP